ncbi:MULTISPECIES: hypothetical protein [unclassified Streptomyces]|uniref:hypothetical protein n=1 Tax=unclassified Streptomyces TaxID=2593676 RepID=UPI002E359A18|nr:MULTISPECIES: hypothetical protein [unclassified Streptomyces]WUC62843.1 hypothetical protein OG861_00710 [Streptomyces sp. NBC_00539]
MTGRTDLPVIAAPGPQGRMGWAVVEHRVIVAVYPSPLLLRLVDASGVQRIARTTACEELGCAAECPHPGGTRPGGRPAHRTAGG